MDCRQAGPIHKREIVAKDLILHQIAQTIEKMKRYELHFLKMKSLKAGEMPNNNLQGQTLKDAG